MLNCASPYITVTLIYCEVCLDLIRGTFLFLSVFGNMTSFMSGKHVVLEALVIVIMTSYVALKLC